MGKAISTPAGVPSSFCERAFPLQLALIVYQAWQAVAGASTRRTRPKKYTSRRPTTIIGRRDFDFWDLLRFYSNRPFTLLLVPLWYQYRCSTCALKINTPR